jgi:hypothetical protein
MYCISQQINRRMGNRFNILKTIDIVRTTKFSVQQNGQCSINVTIRRVRVTLVPVE